MSDVNWANAVSMVATEEGLLVTERGADGMVGASPRLLGAAAPWDRPGPGRQTNSSFPRTPEEFGNETMMTCTDSALKTYRFIVAPKGFVREVNDVMAGKQPKTGRYMMPFKACSDADAWGVLFSPYTVFDEALCWRLERLDAKPGYASSWTLVKTLNC